MPKTPNNVELTAREVSQEFARFFEIAVNSDPTSRMDQNKRVTALVEASGKIVKALLQLDKRVTALEKTAVTDDGEF